MAFTAIGNEFQVDTFPSRGLDHPSIAADTNGNFVVAWMQTSLTADDYDVFVQRYDNSGSPLGDKLKIDDGGSVYLAAIASAPNGDFTIIWKNLSASNGGIFGQRYNNAGIPQGGEFQVANSTAGVPSVAMNSDSSFVVTWADDRDLNNDLDIFVQRYDRDGTLSGSELQVNTSTPGTNVDLDIATDSEGDFTIVWDSALADGNNTLTNIHGRRYNRNGSPEGDEFIVNSNAQRFVGEPHIAVASDGSFAIAWGNYGRFVQLSSLYARYYDSSGIPQSVETLVDTPNSNLDIENQLDYPVNIQSDIASVSNGEYIITWANGTWNGWQQISSAIDARRYRGTNTGSTGSLNITGTDASEFFAGSEFADTIAGAGGNDTITGSADNDALSGDAGNDSLAGDEGNDTMRGGEDNDTITGGPGQDTVMGNQGDDLLAGSEGFDSVFSGRGNDTASGGLGGDLIGGGSGNDRLEGDWGNDTMFGGTDNDSLAGGDDNDVLNGISPLSDNQGRGEIDTLTGGSGQDLFVLAASSRNYYSDGSAVSPGLGDYALITDLNLSESDTLQLRRIVKYVASNAPASLGLTGAGLFIDTDNSGSFTANDELIAVVLNVTPADLLNAPKSLV